MTKIEWYGHNSPSKYSRLIQTIWLCLKLPISSRESFSATWNAETTSSENFQGRGANSLCHVHYFLVSAILDSENLFPLVWFDPFLLSGNGNPATLIQIEITKTKDCDVNFSTVMCGPWREYVW